MIRTRTTRWSIQLLENERWREVYVGSRFVNTVQAWLVLCEAGLYSRIYREAKLLCSAEDQEQLSLIFPCCGEEAS